MTTITEKVKYVAEVNYPAILGFVGVVAAIVYSPEAFAYMKKQTWEYNNVYDNVLTLASTFTAFLFTFYTFVITTESGFIGRARNSTYFKAMISYSLQALASGAVLTVATIPMTIIQPFPTADDTFVRIVFALWFGLTVMAAAGFVRATHIFAIFAAQHH